MNNNTDTAKPSDLQELLCKEAKEVATKTDLIDCPIAFQEGKLVKEIKNFAVVLLDVKKIVIESPTYSMLDYDKLRMTQRLVTLGYKLEVF